MKSAKNSEQTVASYLAALTPKHRSALKSLRKDILAAAADAEECISYRMPAFRVHGRVLFWMGSTSNHCAFYPGATVTQFASELKDYKTSKGTIRFTPEKPLPSALVKKIVKARIAQFTDV